MKISQRRVRGLVAAAIAASVIAGPVIASMPAQAASELTFWSWRTEDKAFYEDQLAIFKEKTGITVKFTPYVNTEYNAILSTALTAGSGPDVMQIRPYGGMATLSDAGNFLALTTTSPTTIHSVYRVNRLTESILMSVKVILLLILPWKLPLKWIARVVYWHIR